MRFGVFVITAICVLSACGSPDPHLPTATAQAAAAPGIDSVLGFKPELASERSVSELRGDFNGDGVEDHLLVVKSASMPKQAPQQVKVVRPWPLEQGETAGDLAHGASVNFVIIHGKDTAPASRVVVLHDDNSVSLLDAPGAAELQVVKRAKLTELEEPALAQAAKGDVLSVPTPAGIDTYIYWDGSTYKLFAPVEAP
jgi:hypothetical protein